MADTGARTDTKNQIPGTNQDFDSTHFDGLLIKGNLLEALRYIAQFPGQEARYHDYLSLFGQEKYITYDVGSYLNGILLFYQQYYREIFYLCTAQEEAEENMRRRFLRFFHLTDCKQTIEEIEDNQISYAFTSRGFHFLGGKTCGYFGPYIWRVSKSQTYQVELPDTTATYPLLFLDGFIMRSWLDYISLGKIGTGGWSNGDGIINCVKSCFDTESENFTVSLLKHEAQHAADLSRFKNMPLEMLEYRAKLVELIYSKERNLLLSFLSEADNTDESNGHACASAKIVEGFAQMAHPSGKTLESLSVPEIQAIAKELFGKSNAKMSFLSMP